MSKYKEETPNLPGMFISLEEATQAYLDVLEQIVPCGHDTPWIPCRYIPWGDCNGACSKDGKDCMLRVLFDERELGLNSVGYRRGCVKFAVKQLLNKLQEIGETT